MSGDTVKHVFALKEQKHQENSISKDFNWRSNSKTAYSNSSSL